MKTLVTGATGFVGSAVARLLIDSGEDVRLMTRARSDKRNLIGLDAEIVEGDLLDKATLKRAVKGCGRLYHVAADYRLWTPQPDLLYKTNVDGSRDLLLAAAEAGCERMVYTSSVATLGVLPGDEVADEDTPSSIDDMIGHYKRSKFFAEQAVQALADQGLPIIIVNPSAPIGPRDVKPTPTGRTVLDAAAGKMPAYVDTGLNIVHVDDVARGHLLAADQGEIGRRYILGGHNMTLKEILVLIARIVGKKPPRIQLSQSLLMPLAHVAEAMARFSKKEPRLTVDGLRMSEKRMYFSSARAERELGYTARPAREALRDAIAWYAAQGYLKLTSRLKAA